MKVVIDTNVVVSAALKDRKPEAIIVFDEAYKISKTTVLPVSQFKRLVSEAAW